MREFIVLIGEIFIITMIQTVIEVFLDAEKRPYQIRMINIACILGSLYLLLQFVFNYILKEITTVVKFPF